MEIKINIPKNEYVQPTEVRQEVVQALCNYMLDNDGWCRVFHPKHDGYGRNPNVWLRRKKGTQQWYMCCYDRAHEQGYENTHIHGTEVQAAFKALISAGYHIFKVYEYRTWSGYQLSKKPEMDGCTEVEGFTEFID